MKRFKDLVKQLPNWKNSPLSFPSSFREIKDSVDWSKSPLMFQSAFGELRKSPSNNLNTNESYLEESTSNSWHKNPPKEGFKSKLNSKGAFYNSAFHDHSDIIPKKLTASHRSSLQHYCTTSSKKSSGHASSENMNSMLRNMAGDKSYRIVGKHTSERVLESIKKLKSAFIPENTNRRDTVTWGGIPSHIGHSFTDGSEHFLPGFTSTSSSKGVAADFADQYNEKLPKDHPDKDKLLHIAEYKLKKGTGLSAASLSSYGEQEVILNHGLKVSYHGSKDVMIPHPRDPNKKIKARIHYLTVHPNQKPLEEYGSYDHPEY